MIICPISSFSAVVLLAAGVFATDTFPVTGCTNEVGGAALKCTAAQSEGVIKAAGLTFNPLGDTLKVHTDDAHVTNVPQLEFHFTGEPKFDDAITELNTKNVLANQKYSDPKCDQKSGKLTFKVKADFNNAKTIDVSAFANGGPQVFAQAILDIAKGSADLDLADVTCSRVPDLIATESCSDHTSPNTLTCSAAAGDATQTFIFDALDAPIVLRGTNADWKLSSAGAKFTAPFVKLEGKDSAVAAIKKLVTLTAGKAKCDGDKLIYVLTVPKAELTDAAGDGGLDGTLKTDTFDKLLAVSSEGPFPVVTVTCTGLVKASMPPVPVVTLPTCTADKGKNFTCKVAASDKMPKLATVSIDDGTEKTTVSDDGNTLNIVPKLVLKEVTDTGSTMLKQAIDALKPNEANFINPKCVNSQITYDVSFVKAKFEGALTAATTASGALSAGARGALEALRDFSPGSAVIATVTCKEDAGKPSPSSVNIEDKSCDAYTTDDMTCTAEAVAELVSVMESIDITGKFKLSTKKDQLVGPPVVKLVGKEPPAGTKAAISNLKTLKAGKATCTESTKKLTYTLGVPKSEADNASTSPGLDPSAKTNNFEKLAKTSVDGTIGISVVNVTCGDLKSETAPPKEETPAQKKIREAAEKEAAEKEAAAKKPKKDNVMVIIIIVIVAVVIIGGGIAFYVLSQDGGEAAHDEEGDDDEEGDKEDEE